MVEIGQKAPGFCLSNQDEEEICLRDLAGGWVVLYFYPRDNTPGCTTEALDFSALVDEFASIGAAVFGISPDSVVRHRNFITKKGIKIPLLADEDKSVCEAYGVWQLKKNYGREYMGVVRSTFIIDPSGDIVAKWDRVRVKGHAQTVLEELKRLVG